METTKSQEEQQIKNQVKAGKDNPANGEAAHSAAEADIQTDPDLADHDDKGDELDEGELARLEGEK
jgi:hypothetical protein